MWVRNTFQRPANLGTLTGMAAGGPLEALQCFYCKLLEAGCLLTARTVYLPPSPSLDNFSTVSCWTVPPLPAVLILLQPRAHSQISARRELLPLPVCLTSRTGFSGGKAVCVGKSHICCPVWYCMGGQAAESPLLPSFLFPPSSCCHHCKALCSPRVSSFLLSEGKELCNQWGWSLPCTYEFTQPALSKCLLSGGYLCCSCI